MQDYQKNVFGNAHSDSPCSRETDSAVESVRSMILRFFNASKTDYSVVFTAEKRGTIPASMWASAYFVFAD